MLAQDIIKSQSEGFYSENLTISEFEENKIFLKIFSSQSCLSLEKVKLSSLSAATGCPDTALTPEPSRNAAPTSRHVSTCPSPACPGWSLLLCPKYRFFNIGDSNNLMPEARVEVAADVHVLAHVHLDLDIALWVIRVNVVFFNDPICNPNKGITPLLSMLTVYLVSLCRLSPRLSHSRHTSRSRCASPISCLCVVVTRHSLTTALSSPVPAKSEQYHNLYPGRDLNSDSGAHVFLNSLCLSNVDDGLSMTDRYNPRLGLLCLALDPSVIVFTTIILITPHCEVINPE